MEFVNGIDVDDYLALREAVGWQRIHRKQAQAGLEHSCYIISCRDGEKTIGTARVLWDRGYVAYIADVMVLPSYQRQGIGKQMMAHIMDYLESQLKEGWSLMVNLMAAKGKEPFYKGFNFIERPSDIYGAGMMQWLIKK